MDNSFIVAWKQIVKLHWRNHMIPDPDISDLPPELVSQLRGHIKRKVSRQTLENLLADMAHHLINAHSLGPQVRAEKRLELLTRYRSLS